jgi:hypothetical protein
VCAPGDRKRGMEAPLFAGIASPSTRVALNRFWDVATDARHGGILFGRVVVPLVGCLVRCNQQSPPSRSAQVLSKLPQPSGHSLSGLRMGEDATFFNCLFAARDSLEKAHSLLQGVIAIDIDEVCAGQAMLSNENWLSALFQFGEQFSGLTLQGGNKFSTHRVILKYHSSRWQM